MREIRREKIVLSRRYIYFFAIVSIGGFFLIFGHTAVWYDEANYLVLANAITELGYPIWLFDPDKPSMFLSSPPALLYLLSFFSTSVRHDLFLLRSINSIFSLTISFGGLFIYLRQQAFNPILLGITALFCAVTYFFVVELVQIRNDLMLAALSFLVLVLAAFVQTELEKKPRTQFRSLARRSLCLKIGLLIAVSALASLMKFQALCLTVCLFLDIMWYQNFRRSWSWLPFFANIAGSIIGIVVLAVIVLTNPLIPGISAIHSSLAHDLDRVAGPQFSLFFDLGEFLIVFEGIVPMFIVPVLIFLIAKYMTGVVGNRDPLCACSNNTVARFRTLDVSSTSSRMDRLYSARW